MSDNAKILILKQITTDASFLRLFFLVVSDNAKILILKQITTEWCDVFVKI